jgi:hypothetical protein
VAQYLRHSEQEDTLMQNTLADFPPDRFSIHAYCECGHNAQIDLARLSENLTINSLRARLRCAACGGREISIRIGWTAAGGFRYSAGAMT